MQVADEAFEHLLSFLDLNMESLSTETCVIIKDLLRKYPEHHEVVVPALQRILRTVKSPEGKVAVVWMIGEYGDEIPDAPYILEDLIDEYLAAAGFVYLSIDCFLCSFDNEKSCLVRSELLSSTVKLFFKRPPEVQKMLGRLLRSAIDDMNQEVIVRDRALLYYRLLELDVEQAARVINCPKACVESFAESDSTELSNRLFQELNTVSVMVNASCCVSSPRASARGGVREVDMSACNADWVALNQSGISVAIAGCRVQTVKGG